MGVDMRSNLNQRGRAGRRRRPPNAIGAALVELAIVMPILCLLTLGLMEYGWVFMKVSQINQAARHGVRIAVRPNSTTEEINSAVASLMTQAGIKNSDYTLTYGTDANGSNGIVDPPVGQAVKLRISVNYDKLTLTGTGLVPLPSTLQGYGVMAKEGPLED
jgi:Flp pilus assembly protein TadG